MNGIHTFDRLLLLGTALFAIAICLIVHVIAKLIG